MALIKTWRVFPLGLSRALIHLTLGEWNHGGGRSWFSRKSRIELAKLVTVITENIIDYYENLAGGEENAAPWRPASVEAPPTLKGRGSSNLQGVHVHIHVMENVSIITRTWEAEKRMLLAM